MNTQFQPAVALVCVGLVSLISCAAHSASAVGDGTFPAPDFPAGLQWLNVDKPLTLKDLRGKVVVLDFWTFCCINCMHVIPDLKHLESKYGDALAVVGVHSAKFATEKDSDNIRQAVLRYDVTHPVVNDRDFEIWKSYGVSAWPTFVLIDPDGNVVAAHAGEGPYQAFDATIGELIGKFDAEKKINRTPLPLRLEKDTAPPTPLMFPGKIAADAEHLYIADSNHNRVVVLNIGDDSIAAIIGSGTAGRRDGSYAQAEFFRPQGLAVDGSTLYVADTENHAIRKVDLNTRVVSTAVSRASTPAISSPWDVLVHGQTLFVAMAGDHQIWAMNLKTNEAVPYAGSGVENISDGPLTEAAMAQPSGLAGDGSHLYSADSESSSIRAIDFNAAGSVRTVVGRGLFDFGDRDGFPDVARLQHPLGVTFHDGKLYVADTYNNKIKTVDPATGQTQTLIGTGQAGFGDGPALKAELNEPGGLVFVGGKLCIADTNNHLIRVYDPSSGVVSTLEIAEAQKLLPPAEPKAFGGTVITLASQQVKPGTGSVELNVQVPAGYKLNAAAPFYVAVNGGAGRNIVNPSFPMKLPFALAGGEDRVTVDLVAYYCEAQRESLCLVKRLRYVVPVTVSAQASAEVVEVDVKLEPAR